jgi:hypothetical protein
MPEKLGKNFDDKMLKSPLTVGRPNKNEPGPELHNNPVAMPRDPMGFLPGNASTAKKKGGRGSGGSGY